ncbi:MAG: ABC transporter ATP-binding protein [Deltaproteobacteria bacterium]|nr:ABC transporter ATP-binding protein [Deltaproteobacteria bacterium]
MQTGSPVCAIRNLVFSVGWTDPRCCRPLIARVVDAQEGTVFIDETDIRRIPVETLRAHMAVVPQDAFLFSGTVRHSLCFGRENASEEEMQKALRASHLYDSIMQFPHQIDTIIGERGVTLSGGQRQRLALARALLMSAPILLLDDPMSQVDTETAAAILSGIREFSHPRTTVIVSHRLSHVRHADTIVVLDRGRIRETGNHDELMALSGYYSRMYKWQKIEDELNE